MFMYTPKCDLSCANLHPVQQIINKYEQINMKQKQTVRIKKKGKGTVRKKKQENTKESWALCELGPRTRLERSPFKIGRFKAWAGLVHLEGLGGQKLETSRPQVHPAYPSPAGSRPRSFVANWVGRPAHQQIFSSSLFPLL